MLTDNLDVIDPVLDNVRLSDLTFDVRKNKESVLKFLEIPSLSYTVGRDTIAALSTRRGVEQLA